MDGVLVDSSEVHAEAFRRTLAARGLPFPLLRYDAVAGLRTEAAFHHLLANGDTSRGFDEAELEACVREKRAHFRALTGDAAPLIVGAVDTVRALALRGLALGLATSGSRASMLAFLSVSGLESAFSVTLCGEDVVHAKPSPELYVRAFAGLRVEPSEGVVIEDSAAGFAAAKSAGASCVLFRASEETRARHGSAAYAAVDDLLRLLDLFPEVHS